MKQLLVAFAVTQFQVDFIKASECTGCPKVIDPIECLQLTHILDDEKFDGDDEIPKQLKTHNKYCEGWKPDGYCKGCTTKEEDIRLYQSSKEKCEERVKQINSKDSKESPDALRKEKRLCSEWTSDKDNAYIDKPRPKEIDDIIKGVVNSKLGSIDYGQISLGTIQYFHDVTIGDDKNSYKIIQPSHDKSSVYKEIEPYKKYEKYQLWPDSKDMKLVKMIINVKQGYHKGIASIRPSDSFEPLEKEQEPKGVKDYLKKVALINNDNYALRPIVGPETCTGTVDSCPKPPEKPQVVQKQEQEKEKEVEVHPSCPNHCFYTASYEIAANTLSEPTGWTPKLWNQRAVQLEKARKRSKGTYHSKSGGGFSFEFTQYMLLSVGLSFVPSRDGYSYTSDDRWQWPRGYIKSKLKDYKELLDGTTTFKTRDFKKAPMAGLILAVHTNPNQKKKNGHVFPDVNHATAVFKFNGHYWYIDTNEQKILNINKDGKSPKFAGTYSAGKWYGNIAHLAQAYKVDFSLDLGDATKNIDNIAKWVYNKCEERKVVGECGALYHMIIIKDDAAKIDWDKFIKNCKGDLDKYYKTKGVCPDETAAKMVMYDGYHDVNDQEIKDQSVIMYRGYGDYVTDSIILALLEVDILILLLIMFIFCLCAGFISSIAFRIYVDRQNKDQNIGSQRINYQSV